MSCLGWPPTFHPKPAHALMPLFHCSTHAPTFCPPLPPGTKATELMWELKELFDPDYVLNPGVILNKDPLVS